MPICVPVRDLKSTSDFTDLVNREGNVTVTKNGYTAMHCLSDDAYQLMQDEVAKAKLLSRMMLAERQIEEGASRSYSEFAADIRSQYGI